MPLLDGHPLGTDLSLLPSTSWAAALGVEPPFPITLLDLAPLAGPLSPSQLATMLGQAEQARYQAFRYPKRRQEWLGGRLAAKAAVAALLTADDAGREPAAPELVIANDPAGKPHLELPGLAQPVYLSISHSHGRAAALASLHPCGIDLQAGIPTVLRVKERFATPAEEAVLAEALGRQHAELLRLTMLWAAKEAIRKMVPVTPLPAFQDVVLTETRPVGSAHLLLFSTDKICHNAIHPLRVVAAIMNDFALAATALFVS